MNCWPAPLTVTGTGDRLMPMNGKCWCLMVAGCWLLAAPAAAGNLLATAHIESYTSAIADITGVRAMIDGNLVTAWSNTPQHRRPFAFEFSWDLPIVPNGVRVAVPGGPDTGICARVVRIETLAEGTLAYSEARTINLEPREGWQTFLLPAVPTRKMRITVIKNHGDPVYTSINELEILTPAAAGHKESVPARVVRTHGPVWLYNGLSDQPALPYAREALADVFALATGYDGEATLSFGSTPMPFADAGGARLRLGAYTTVLVDRWYEGQPQYRMLVLTGTVFLDAEAAEGEWLVTTGEGAFQLAGTGQTVVRCGGPDGTIIKLNRGQAVIVDRRTEHALPVVDADTALLAVQLRPSRAAATGVLLDRQPDGILTWLAAVAPLNRVGTMWQERRRADSGQAPDTVPALLAPLLREQALAATDTGSHRLVPPGAPIPLADIWRRGSALARLLLTGWPAEALAADSTTPDYEAQLAAAYTLADIGAGGMMSAPAVAPYGSNTAGAALPAGVVADDGPAAGSPWLVVCQHGGKQAIIWLAPDGMRRWKYAAPGEGEALIR